MGVPLYIICYFSLVLSLSLIFVSLITGCLGVFLFGFILPGTLSPSWTWLTISFPMFGKFSTITPSNIFSGPFSCSSPSGTPIMQMLVHLMLSQRSLSYLHFFFHSFSILCSLAVISTILSSRSFIYLFFCFLIPSSEVFISVCLFFSSSRSLVNISCILLISCDAGLSSLSLF